MFHSLLLQRARRFVVGHVEFNGAQLALGLAGGLQSASIFQNFSSRAKKLLITLSIPALLAMKGHAVNGRYKQKDAYDIYYCIRNYPTVSRSC